jgi:hypothetical protein
MGTVGPFTGVKRGQGVTLTALAHLVAEVKNPPLPLEPSSCVLDSFTLLYHVTLLLVFLISIIKGTVIRPFPGGTVRPGRDADHSPPSSAEVVNE